MLNTEHQITQGNQSKLKLSLVAQNILIFLLLAFSGNPIVRQFDKSSILFISLAVLVLFYNSLNKTFYRKFLIITIGLFGLFLCQQLELDYVSWLGGINFIVKIFFGGLIVYLLPDRLPYRFFIVLYYLALISLICFLVINIAGIKPPGIVWGTGNSRERTSYVVYSYLESHPFRNAGMFWEPGAFAGIITLCLALNMNS